MKSKKYFYSIILCVMMILSAVPVYAKEEQQMKFCDIEKEEVTSLESDSLESDTRTLYLVDIQATIAKLGTGKVGILANVYCSDTVKSIKVDFALQKKSGTSWKTMATATASDSNVHSTEKSATATGVTAGTYRAKVTAMVTDKYGYSESLTCYSGSITIS